MAFTLRQHPRVHNKPLHCLSGHHYPWDTQIVAGQPILVCRSCGATVLKGVKEHTYSKGDEHKIFNPHITAMEQRRSLLRKRILEGLKVGY